MKGPAFYLLDQATLSVRFSEVNAIIFKAVDARALRIIFLRSGSKTLHNAIYIKRQGMHKRVTC